MGKSTSQADCDVVWCDKGWQPVHFGFCPSKAAWRAALKHLGAPKTDRYPTSDACTWYFEKKGKTTVLVTLGDHAEKTFDRVAIAGLLCHEAVHVWQTVRRAMQEEKPSIEFEAYSVQAIFQQIYQAWLDTRAPKSMLAACAKRKKSA